jgi:DNA-binding MarR family transcriptional regulator
MMRHYQLATDLFDEAVAAKLGLNRTDFRCLDILDQHAPMTAGALAEASRLTTGAVTFVIDRMEAAGFVRRRRDDADRRRVLVDLVPAARERALSFHLPMVMDARKALAGFTDDEVAVICRFLRTSAEVFERNVPE